jgi:hypothetical protein
MTQSTTWGTKLGAMLVGALLGFFIGVFLGSELGAMASFAWARYQGPQWPSDLGRMLGMITGLIGGGFLGFFLMGRPKVAVWCLGTATAVGGVSFLAGFAGPILLSPNSPQGPLLGIFFTGPLGFVIGAIIGLCIGLMKERPVNA